MQERQIIKPNMKKRFTLVLLFMAALNAHAQDDLLNMLEAEQPQKPVPVYATFKATRVINGQSNEQVAAKHLNFVILHRFGEVNQGAYELWGLDQANIRLVFDYGLTDKIQVGLARSSVGKTYDGNLKIKLLSQSRGKGGMPITLNYYGNMAINTTEWANPNRDNYFTSRLSYFNQIIIARKFSDKLSLQIAPCMVHENLVTYKEDPNTIYAIGTGGSIRLNRSVRFNFEYYPRLNGRDMKSETGGPLYDYLALGFDLETGGHVFQVMLSNGKGMLEQHMVNDTRYSWKDGGVRLGFNIARTFSFDKKKQKG